MTYAELIAAVARHAQLPEPMVAAVLKSTRVQIASALAAGGEVKLPDIGRFSRRLMAARAYRHPVTGAVTELPERSKVSFKAAAALIERIGGPSDE